MFYTDKKNQFEQILNNFRMGKLSKLEAKSLLKQLIIKHNECELITDFSIDNNKVILPNNGVNHIMNMSDLELTSKSDKLIFSLYDFQKIACNDEVFILDEYLTEINLMRNTYKKMSSFNEKEKIQYIENDLCFGGLNLTIEPIIDTLVFYDLYKDSEIVKKYGGRLSIALRTIANDGYGLISNRDWYLDIKNDKIKEKKIKEIIIKNNIFIKSFNENIITISNNSNTDVTVNIIDKACYINNPKFEADVIEAMLYLAQRKVSFRGNNKLKQ